MSHFYRALVEAVADRMIEEDAHRVPLDSLARAASNGYLVEDFEEDVEAEVSARRAANDPSQINIHFPTK